jgi:hypothetical protein
MYVIRRMRRFFYRGTFNERRGWDLGAMTAPLATLNDTASRGRLLNMRDEWLVGLRQWASGNDSVRELWLFGSRSLREGHGILTISRSMRIGTGVVQRIKLEMAFR